MQKMKNPFATIAPELGANLALNSPHDLAQAEQENPNPPLLAKGEIRIYWVSLIVILSKRSLRQRRIRASRAMCRSFYPKSCDTLIAR
jgi:hypothetical protein